MGLCLGWEGGGGVPGACSPGKILVLCSQDPAVLCILAVKTE